MRRIGVLMLGDESDPDQQNRVRAFRAELAKMGWTEGRNIRIDSRFAAKLARSRHLDARCCLLLSARSGSKNVSTRLPMRQISLLVQSWLVEIAAGLINPRSGDLGIPPPGTRTDGRMLQE